MPKLNREKMINQKKINLFINAVIKDGRSWYQPKKDKYYQLKFATVILLIAQHGFNYVARMTHEYGARCLFHSVLKEHNEYNKDDNIPSPFSTKENLYLSHFKMARKAKKIAERINHFGSLYVLYLVKSHKKLFFYKALITDMNSVPAVQLMKIKVRHYYYHFNTKTNSSYRSINYTYKWQQRWTWVDPITRKPTYILYKHYINRLNSRFRNLRHRKHGADVRLLDTSIEPVWNADGTNHIHVHALICSDHLLNISKLVGSATRNPKRSKNMQKDFHRIFGYYSKEMTIKPLIDDKTRQVVLTSTMNKSSLQKAFNIIDQFIGYINKDYKLPALNHGFIMQDFIDKHRCIKWKQLRHLMTDTLNGTYGQRLQRPITQQTITAMKERPLKYGVHELQSSIIKMCRDVTSKYQKSLFNLQLVDSNPEVAYYAHSAFNGARQHHHYTTKQNIQRAYHKHQIHIQIALIIHKARLAREAMKANKLPSSPYMKKGSIGIEANRAKTESLCTTATVTAPPWFEKRTSGIPP